MIFRRALFVTAVAMTLSACAGGDSSTSSQGQGTVTITGAVEKSVSFGGKESDTRVGCFENGSTSYMRLYIPGTSAASTEMREGLKIEFHGRFPKGNYIFRGHNVSYTLEDAQFVSSGDQCSVNISSAARKLFVNLSCLDMKDSESGHKIAVVADFECTVAK
jgi:hypothetical protein